MKNKVAALFFMLFASVASYAAGPIAGFTYSNLCTSPFTTFTDASTDLFNPIVSWKWDFGDPGSGALNSSVNQNETHTFVAPATYAVKLIVIDAGGQMDSITHNVTILPSPVADFIYSIACDGTPIQFTDQSGASSPDVITGWNWSFGDLTGSSAQSPVKLYGAANTYTCKLTVNSSNGCSGSNTQAVVVHSYPKVKIQTSKISCIGAIHSFYDFSTLFNGTVTGRLWTIGSYATDTVKNPVYTFNSIDSVLIKLSVTGEGGCNSSDSTMIYTVGPPDASFLTTPLEGYPPLNVKCFASDTSMHTYTWNFGQGNSGTFFDSASYLYPDTGKYTICLIGANMYGCSDTSCTDIEVKAPHTDLAVIDVITKDVSNSLSVIARVANYGNLTVNTAEIHMSVGSITRITEKFKGPLKPGHDTLFYFSSSVQLNPNHKDDFVCVEILNPDGVADDDADNDRLCRSISDKFHASEPFPNPAHRSARVEVIIPQSGIIQLEIYDGLGRQVHSLTNESAQRGLNIFVLDLTDFRNGMYTCKTMYDGNEVVHRFVKY